MSISEPDYTEFVAWGMPIRELATLAEQRGCVAADFWPELCDEFLNMPPDSYTYQRVWEEVGAVRREAEEMDDLFPIMAKFLDLRSYTRESLRQLIMRKGSLLVAIARAAAEGEHG